MIIKAADNTKKILVIGGIYDKWNLFLPKLEELCNKYEFVIINGNAIDSDIESIKSQQEKFNNLLYCNGDKDLIYKIKGNDEKIINWIKGNSNVIQINFDNGSKCLIMSGGLKPGFKYKDLSSLEVSFINLIDEKPWHESYGGGLGYIISNNPLTIKEPAFYNYSCQIGNKSDSTCVYAQEIDKFGAHLTIRFNQ